MMYSQLHKSSLYSLLRQTGIQQAEGRVRSKSLLEEMSLIGFIPYTEYSIELWNFGLNVDLNNHLYVAPNLIKFSKDTPAYPYFRAIEAAEGKKYKMDNRLIIDSIIDKIPEYVLKYKDIARPFTGEAFLKIRTKQWNPESLLEDSGNGEHFYVGKRDEWELSCGLADIISVSNNFLCLCSYINKVTGTPSYAVLTSDDAIRVLPEDEHE